MLGAVCKLSKPANLPMVTPEVRLIIYFWLRWLLVNVLGWAAAASLVLMFRELMVPAVCLAFAFVGILQWCLLRRLIPRLGKWAIATAIGGIMGVILGTILLFATNPSMGVMLLGGAIGGSVGLAQALVMQGRMPMTLAWFMANLLAGAVSVPIGIYWSMGNTNSLDRLPFAFLVGGIIVESLSATVSGTVMIWLIQLRHKNNPVTSNNLSPDQIEQRTYGFPESDS